MPYVDPKREEDAIAAAQIEAFYKETSVGNILGAVVLSLIVWGNAHYAPLWTWVPALAAVYAVTVYRAYLFRQHRRDPVARTPGAWGLAQTFAATIAGLSWGYANTAMCFFLPVENQLFVAAVAAVAGSYAAAGGIAYMPPPYAFIAASLLPLSAWFFYAGDRLHVTLATMLLIFVASSLLQGTKRHRAFNESLRLRFRNEYLARELAAQIEIADAAAKAKTRFLAAASHDLRQPVQALTIFQELIRSEMTLTPKGEGYFSTMQQAVHSVHGLLDALLDVSKLDAEAIQVRREQFPVAELLEQMRVEFAPTAAQGGVDLRIVDCSLALDTDPLLLGQLLRNLLSNALRYAPSGKVLLGCRRQGDGLRIEVWDTGIGIHPEHRKAIFSEFFQVGNRERDRQKGLGLGLAIAERVARLLGVTIEVRSTVGKGSCFSVCVLPCVQVSGPQPPVAFRAEYKLAGSTVLEGLLVAVVENEHTIRKGVHEFLESLGCEVISGVAKDEVAERIRDVGRPVDVLISDFGLPGDENGIEVIQKLRQEQGREVAALLITGDTCRSVVGLAAEAGIAILYKPVQPGMLQQALASATGRDKGRE
jgi:signal transduction histidine kinase/CheY-like chemotaxis protein